MWAFVKTPSNVNMEALRMQGVLAKGRVVQDLDVPNPHDHLQECSLPSVSLHAALGGKIKWFADFSGAHTLPTISPRHSHGHHHVVPVL